MIPMQDDRWVCASDSACRSSTSPPSLGRGQAAPPPASAGHDINLLELKTKITFW